MAKSICFNYGVVPACHSGLCMVCGIAIALVLQAPLCDSAEFLSVKLQQVHGEYNCEGLYGENDAHTEHLMKECHALMRTSIMQKTKEYLMTVAEEELIAGTRPKRSASKCPVMTDEYLANSNAPLGLRSLSPYEAIVDHNLNRFPRYILRHTCLCKGCIDLRTRRESPLMVSQRVVSNSRVFYRDSPNGAFKLGHEAVEVGCTCVFPQVE